jgi:hypothetical protein
VFVSGGVAEPSTRYDEYGNPFRTDNPPPAPPRPPQRLSSAPPPPTRTAPPPRSQPQPQFQPPPTPPPAASRPATVYDGARPRRGPLARALLMLFVLALLVATPLAAGCVSYYLTTDHWPAPVADWFGADSP